MAKHEGNGGGKYTLSQGEISEYLLNKTPAFISYDILILFLINKEK